ncbi:MAG: ATP-binding protein [Syntrophales bacterium]|jgi:hypothetical protein
MDKITPFSQEDLNEIFKISSKDPERVISRESSNLEFKESFGWKSIPKYIKTAAAYANAKGGYIVFGIANRPHKLIGLKGTNLQSFEGIEPEKMTRYLNEHFSPEISWDVQEYVLNGKTYGLLYVHESHDKPIVCTKDAEKELKEGDIYYRYRGRSEKIKYPELRVILDQKRENEQRLWMQHLSQITRIGVRDVGIFDLQTGYVTGTNSSFLIDESLLSQLAFIKEGEFSEVKGKPALKLIGNMEAITDLPNSIARKQIVKIRGIRIGDIVLAFLSQAKVTEPLEYIKQICFESTAFLPVYYFMRLGNLDRNSAIELVISVVSRSPAKKKLVERLRQKNTQKLPLRDWKQHFNEQMKLKNIKSDLTGKELENCLQALRSLTPEDVKNNSAYLRGLLKTWFNKHYASAQGSLAGNLRRAICWVDEACYMEGAE